MVIKAPRAKMNNALHFIELNLIKYIYNGTQLKSTKQSAID